MHTQNTQKTSVWKRDVSFLKKIYIPARNSRKHDQRREDPSIPNNPSTTSLQDGFPTTHPSIIYDSCQLFIQNETGTCDVIDPWGGSFFIEKLTDEIEAKAEQYFSEIDNLGGVISAIEEGYFQREIARSASDYQLKVDSKRRIVVGVNQYVNKKEEIELEEQKEKEFDERQVSFLNIN